ncbi:MAG: nucleoside phosphorylase [Salinivirgaceae bacterium]|jgi:uridine phosphorylase|nr:nucleoside phosphorylase [Bacteroidales bacterium]
MRQIQQSELILNPDGSIYHLNLLPEDISDLIILVGDQDRVPVVSHFFDTIEVKKQNREFRTHTGTYKERRISVISTGIGTDNIDIVINELDALVNIDLKTREAKSEHKTLNFIRIGTSGALQADIPVNTPVAATIGCGFDGLLNFYADRNKVSLLKLENAFLEHMKWNKLLATPYFVEGSDFLLNKVAFDMVQGITISAPGFYGPQGRVLRLPIADSNINDKIASFACDSNKITNYEMECSAIYGLSKLLNHNALTICNIIANRQRGEYSSDYKQHIVKLIKTVLDRFTA